MAAGLPVLSKEPNPPDAACRKGRQVEGVEVDLAAEPVPHNVAPHGGLGTRLAERGEVQPPRAEQLVGLGELLPQTLHVG